MNTRDDRGPLSIAVLHPTFESWGGAEWFIAGLLDRLCQEPNNRVTLFTHRYSGATATPQRFSRIEHKLGGELTGPEEWSRIGRWLAPQLAQFDLAFVHNFPATQWYAAAAAVKSVPPAVWFCHEPPRAIHGPFEEETRARTGGKNRIGRLMSALSFYRLGIFVRAARKLQQRWHASDRTSDEALAELRELDARGVAAMACVIANSRYTATRVQQLYGRDAHVVAPVPADLAELPPSATIEKDDSVLWVGRLSEIKRPSIVLDAWKVARQRNAELASYRLVMIGDGPLRSRIEARATEPGVDFRPRVSRAELIELYRRARLAIHTARAEPFGLVPLEALAAGTPVLANAEGGVLETVTDRETGWLVPNLDCEALVESLCRMPQSIEELDLMGRRATRSTRESYSFERSFERIASLMWQTYRHGEARHEPDHESPIRSS